MTRKSRVWINVTEEKHKAFKLACVLLGYSAKEWLEQAMDDAIERAKNVDLTELWLELGE